MLEAKDIHYTIGRKQILNGISAGFAPGSFNMILGPNGSGKSTFLKIFSGEITTYQGTVLYGNRHINSYRKAELATFRAVMSQQPDLGFPLSVEEVVMMGRYPHFTFNPSGNDERICREVMERMQLQGFSERNYLTLSGGEKQRVQYARVLAQVWEKPAGGCRYLFLDEPLTSLDVNFQQEFLEVAREFLKSDTVLVAVMHDINLAAQYGDQLFFLKEGRLIRQGAPQEILREDLLEEVFAVKTHIITHPVTNMPVVVYKGR